MCRERRRCDGQRLVDISLLRQDFLAFAMQRLAFAGVIGKGRSWMRVAGSEPSRPCPAAGCKGYPVLVGPTCVTTCRFGWRLGVAAAGPPGCGSGRPGVGGTFRCKGLEVSSATRDCQRTRGADRERVAQRPSRDRLARPGEQRPPGPRSEGCVEDALDWPRAERGESWSRR